MRKQTTHPMATGSGAVGDAHLRSSLRLCGARTRQGGTCRHVAMVNGRCRFHGGLSTGARTAEGLARLRASRTVRGQHEREAKRLREMIRDLKAGARRLVELA